MELVLIFNTWFLAKNQVLLSMLGFGSVSIVMQAAVLIGIVVFVVAARILLKGIPNSKVTDLKNELLELNEVLCSQSKKLKKRNGR